MKTEDERPRSETLKRVLKPVMPRRLLYMRLGTDTSRTNDLLQGQDPGSTARLARVVGQVVVPTEGREKAGEVVIAMLEELHPKAFAPVTPVTDAA